MPSENVTFSGTWTFVPDQTYTVTYYINDGTSAATTQTKGQGIALTLRTPVRDGHEFIGWNTAANGSGTSYAGGATYTNDANLTLYAQWEKEL